MLRESRRASIAPTRSAVAGGAEGSVDHSGILSCLFEGGVADAKNDWTLMLVCYGL